MKNIIERPCIMVLEPCESDPVMVRKPSILFRQQNMSKAELLIQL